jgi:hypothetical protein
LRSKRSSGGLALWANERKGGDSNPRGGGCPPAGFQDQCIQPLCHPSACRQMLRACSTRAAMCHATASKLCRSQTGRGGREAEGTRLLSEYGGQTPSRVRIPPSPPFVRRSKQGQRSAQQCSRPCFSFRPGLLEPQPRLAPTGCRSAAARFSSSSIARKSVRLCRST